MGADVEVELTCDVCGSSVDEGDILCPGCIPKYYSDKLSVVAVGDIEALLNAIAPTAAAYAGLDPEVRKCWDAVNAGLKAKV